MSFGPIHNPTVPDPWRRDPVIDLPFTRTEQDKAIERLEQKRRQEQEIKDQLGRAGDRILGRGGDKSRMAGEAIGVDAAAAAEGNKTGEAIGSTLGGIAAGAGLGMLDGPSPVLDIVGGTIGSQVGGMIGSSIPAGRARQDAELTAQHQARIAARDPRSQGRLPFGLEGSFLDPKNHVVY